MGTRGGETQETERESLTQAQTPMFDTASGILINVQNHSREKHAFTSEMCVPFRRAGIVSTFISAVFLRSYLFCAEM